MNEMRERIARAVREGRRCGTASEPLMVPCPFCEWGPDKLTAEFDETGCLWIADDVLAAINAALKEPAFRASLLRNLLG